MADYWTNLFLLPSPTVSLPADFNTLDNKINLVSFNIDINLTSTIISYINNLNEIEKNSIFLTSLLIILNRRTQLSDLVIASQINNSRYLSDVLLRINIDEGMSYDTLYNSVKNHVKDASENLGMINLFIFILNSISA